eukprot:18523-Heterococcus_DN1.PRE.3
MSTRAILCRDLRGVDEGYRNACEHVQQDMDGMDKISFTSQLTQALQKLPHTSDDVEGAAII